MYIPGASMGEYDSYSAPAPRKKPPGSLERSDSRRGVERTESRGSLGRQGSRVGGLSRQGSAADLSRSGSRRDLTRAGSQSYLRNYSPLPGGDHTHR